MHAHRHGEKWTRASAARTHHTVGLADDHQGLTQSVLTRQLVHLPRPHTLDEGEGGAQGSEGIEPAPSCGVHAPLSHECDRQRPSHQSVAAAPEVGVGWPPFWWSTLSADAVTTDPIPRGARHVYAETRLGQPRCVPTNRAYNGSGVNAILKESFPELLRTLLSRPSKTRMCVTKVHITELRDSPFSTWRPATEMLTHKQQATGPCGVELTTLKRAFRDVTYH